MVWHIDCTCLYDKIIWYSEWFYVDCFVLYNGMMNNLRIFLLAQLPNAGQCRLMLEVCRSHTITNHGRTPLDEGSARRTDLYLTTCNTQKRLTSMPPAGFEPSIPASEWPRLRPLGHGDRQSDNIRRLKFMMHRDDKWLESTVRW